ncbi:MAG: PAS domain-containing protein [bacterium]|nr:PAS domain-containing protein [bacterium]
MMSEALRDGAPGGDLGEEFRLLEEKVRQLRESLDELREIQALARTIRSSASPEEILAGLTDILGHVLPAPETGLFLLQGEDLVAVGDPSLGLRHTLHSLQEDGITRWVLDEQRPISVPRLDDASPDCSDLLIPLIVMGTGIGVLLVRSPQLDEDLTSHQMDLLAFAAGQAATALENARLVEHLEDSRRQLQEMIDSASDLILLVDDEGRITYANARTQWLGEPRERLVGRCLPDFARTGEGGSALLGGIQRRERALLELDLCNPALPGLGPVLAQLSLSPLAPTHPSEATCMIILRDLTERRRLEEQAREAETLKAVMLAAVTVNHEINNPLTAIVGNLFLLRRELEGLATPEILQRIDTAERSARQIEAVAHKLEQVSVVRRVRYLGETDMLDIEPGGTDAKLEESSAQPPSPDPEVAHP